MRLTSTRALITLSIATLLAPACGGNVVPAHEKGSPEGVQQLASGVPAGATAPAPLGSMAALLPADKQPTLDYFAGMATGDAQFKSFCAHGFQDKFSVAYCAAATPPSITSMAELLDLVGVRKGIVSGAQGFNFAITSQSASLVSRATSVLNPRAIAYDANMPFVAFGFARGDNVVEIGGFDPNTKDINFALVHYSRACDKAGTCTNADRFLPANETGWTDVSVYTGHDDLMNTPRQCDTCHRPGGFDYTSNTGSTSILRMQQLVNPWMTWFRSDRGGAPLVAQFCKAHTNEDYAAIPFAQICGQNAPQGTGGNPASLERSMIEAHGYQNDPHVIVFRGAQINGDNFNFQGPPNQTWLGFFSDVLAGKIIHVPFYEISAFDDTKVTAATTSYQAVAAGSMPGAAMPDITAKPLLKSEAIPYVSHQGITTNPATGQAATATEVINQQCATCHTGNFPGAGNRENFKVSDFPGNLTAEMKQKVGNRICRPSSSVYLMPPAMFAELTEANRALILESLGLPTTCPNETWFPGQQ